jgi:hypothetical protein
MKDYIDAIFLLALDVLIITAIILAVYCGVVL